jgi:hypothetical protein
VFSSGVTLEWRDFRALSTGGGTARLDTDSVSNTVPALDVPIDETIPRVLSAGLGRTGQVVHRAVLSYQRVRRLTPFQSYAGLRSILKLRRT